MADEEHTDPAAWLREVQRVFRSMPKAMREAALASCRDTSRGGTNNHELNIFDEARSDEWPLACVRCGAVHAGPDGFDWYSLGYFDGKLGRHPIMAVHDG